MVINVAGVDYDLGDLVEQGWFGPAIQAQRAEHHRPRIDDCGQGHRAQPTFGQLLEAAKATGR